MSLCRIKIGSGSESNPRPTFWGPLRKLYTRNIVVQVFEHHFGHQFYEKCPSSCPSLGNPSSNGRPSTSVRHPYVDGRPLEDGLPRLLMPYLNSNASSSSLSIVPLQPRYCYNCYNRDIHLLRLLKTKLFPAVWKEDSKSQQTTTVCSKHSRRASRSSLKRRSSSNAGSRVWLQKGRWGVFKYKNAVYRNFWGLRSVSG